jgi:hypothetical protein
MMLARPPDTARRDPAEGCARRPGLRRGLWLAWLAVVLLLALTVGHGL